MMHVLRRVQVGERIHTVSTIACVLNWTAACGVFNTYLCRVKNKGPPYRVQLVRVLGVLSPTMYVCELGASLTDARVRNACDLATRAIHKDFYFFLFFTRNRNPFARTGAPCGA